MHEFNTTVTLGEETLEVCVVITDYTAHQAGRYSGPPEDCYPDEPAEVEFDVYCDGVLRNDLVEYVCYDDVLDEAEKHVRELYENSYDPEDYY